MATPFVVGSRVRLQASFTNVGGSLFDPSTVSLSYRRPVSGDPQKNFTVSYPGAITRASSGVYYIDLLLDYDGDYFYKWSSADSGLESVKESSFKVSKSKL